MNSFEREKRFATRATGEAQTVSDRRNVRTRYAQMREKRTKFAFGLRHTVETSMHEADYNCTG